MSKGKRIGKIEMPQEIFDGAAALHAHLGNLARGKDKCLRVLVTSEGMEDLGPAKRGADLPVDAPAEEPETPAADEKDPDGDEKPAADSKKADAKKPATKED